MIPLFQVVTHDIIISIIAATKRRNTEGGYKMYNTLNCYDFCNNERIFAFSFLKK